MGQRINTWARLGDGNKANAPTNGKAVCAGTEAIITFDAVANATEYILMPLQIIKF